MFPIQVNISRSVLRIAAKGNDKHHQSGGLGGPPPWPHWLPFRHPHGDVSSWGWQYHGYRRYTIIGRHWALSFYNSPRCLEHYSVPRSATGLCLWELHSVCWSPISSLFTIALLFCAVLRGAIVSERSFYPLSGVKRIKSISICIPYIPPAQANGKCRPLYSCNEEPTERHCVPE